MKTTPKQYARALYELSRTASSEEMAAHVLAVGKTLRAAGNGHLLSGILKEYRTLLTKKSELPEVVVRSADTLAEQTQKDILGKLGIDTQTTVISRIDPEMIGGVFVKNNNKLFDLSLARRLSRLGQRLKSLK